MPATGEVMKVKQIALSPDGSHIYAVDEQGGVWVAAQTPMTGKPANSWGPNLKPNWEKVASPLKAL
jgi:hypothetical protein